MSLVREELCSMKDNRICTRALALVGTQPSKGYGCSSDRLKVFSRCWILFQTLVSLTLMLKLVAFPQGNDTCGGWDAFPGECQKTINVWSRSPSCQGMNCSSFTSGIVLESAWTPWFILSCCFETAILWDASCVNMRKGDSWDKPKYIL